MISTDYIQEKQKIAAGNVISHFEVQIRSLLPKRKIMSIPFLESSCFYLSRITNKQKLKLSYKDRCNFKLSSFFFSCPYFFFHTMDISELVHNDHSFQPLKRHPCHWPGCHKLFSMLTTLYVYLNAILIICVGRPSDASRHYRIHTNDRYANSRKTVGPIYIYIYDIVTTI